MVGNLGCFVKLARHMLFTPVETEMKLKIRIRRSGFDSL